MFVYRSIIHQNKSFILHGIKTKRKENYFTLLSDKQIDF